MGSDMCLLGAGGVTRLGFVAESGFTAFFCSADATAGSVVDADLTGSGVDSTVVANTSSSVKRPILGVVTRGEFVGLGRPCKTEERETVFRIFHGAGGRPDCKKTDGNTSLRGLRRMLGLASPSLQPPMP